MSNVLLEEVRYKVTETPRGTWKRYVYPTGASYAEYISKSTLLGLPLVHYTRGLCPETGTHRVARGFFAVGRLAVGVIALGRAAAGVVALGQASLGVLALGQVCAGLGAVGQVAVGVALGIGQLATGYVCVAQLGLGKWVLAQLGLGRHVWSTHVRDPAAVELFKTLASGKLPPRF
jgi:hypothetical protein